MSIRTKHPLLRLDNSGRLNGQGWKMTRTKTNDSLELSLEAAHEVMVAATSSDCASQFHGAENVDKAAVFKGASRTLRGTRL
jgi:uncharacterized protein (DUF736 family)